MASTQTSSPVQALCRAVAQWVDACLVLRSGSGPIASSQVTRRLTRREVSSSLTEPVGNLLVRAPREGFEPPTARSVAERQT